MKKDARYYAQSTLFLRLLAGGYLCYTAWKLREAMAENPLFIIAIAAFAIAGAAIMAHAGWKLFKGEYQGGPATITVNAAEEENEADVDN